MEGTKQIKLRGHHVSSLAEYFYLVRHQAKDLSGYSENHDKFTKELFEFIINNPDAEIFLTDTIDSICEAECPARRYREESDLSDFNECDGEYVKYSERLELEAYGLSLGQVSAKEVMDKIKQYHDSHIVEEDGNKRPAVSYRDYKFQTEDKELVADLFSIIRIESE